MTTPHDTMKTPESIEETYTDLADDVDEGKGDDEPDTYVQYDIKTYSSDPELAALVRQYQRGRIKIPEFQRQFVWDQKRASRLIESFLRGLPVPPIFVYTDTNDKSILIDGQQRLMSIVYFFQGEWTDGKPFKLSGLDKNSPYAGKTFADLDESDQHRLEERVLVIMNVLQRSPDPEIVQHSAYDIFHKINTATTPLTAQEIRNCISEGKLLNELRALNENDHWRAILGKNKADKRQKDIELILRLFALSKFGGQSYKSSLKEFLNDCMERNKEAQSKDWQQFKALFPQACQIILDQLGNEPFRVFTTLNVAAMDAVMCNLINQHNHYPPEFKKRYEELENDADFVNAISNRTSQTVKDRLAKAKEIIWGT